MGNTANSSRFLFTLIGSQEELRVAEIYGQESVSAPFIWQVTVASEDANLDLNALVNRSGLLTLIGEEDQATERLVHGFVSQANYIETGARFSLYRLTLTPQLNYFHYRTGHRIFQDQSVQDIVEQLFSDANIPDDQYQWKLTKSYQPRPYCVQYNESELSFISRLLAEEGIHFHFTHHLDRHVIVFSDNNNVFAANKNANSLPYIQEQSGAHREASAYSFTLNKEITSSHASLLDFNFETPKNALRADKKGDGKDREVAYYPGKFSTQGQGNQYADLRLQQFLCRQTHGEAETNSLLMPGTRFTLTGAKSPAWNQDYLIVDIKHRGQQPQSLEEHASSQPTTYNNTTIVIPSSTPYRPAIEHLSKPNATGVTPATVTGPSGEEIYTDTHGRVKVLFPWDRNNPANEKSSCWLRVKQGWAGVEYGTSVTPRIGQEVLISFENSDPDKPLVTGRLYNGNNKPPYSLPAHKTRTLLKTQSSPKADGYNELRIDDQKDQEQLFIHGEKDIDLHIKQDKKTLIRSNQHSTIEGSQYQQLALSNQTISGQHNEKVGKQLSLSVSKDTKIKISGTNAIQAGNAVFIKSGMKAVLDAGTQLTLKAGAGTICLDPSGVSITGPMVLINEGGGGGSAMAPMATTPTAPVEADKNKAGQNFVPAANTPPTPPDEAAINQASAQAINLRMASSTSAPLVYFPSVPDKKKPATSTAKSTSKKRTTQQTSVTPPVTNIGTVTSTEKNWLQLHLCWDDKHKTPIKQQGYTLHLADGSTRTGTLDDKGQAFEENLPEGTVKVEYTQNTADAAKLQSLKDQFDTTLKDLIDQAQHNKEFQQWVAEDLPSEENGWAYASAAIAAGWDTSMEQSSFDTMVRRGLHKAGTPYLDVLEDIETGNIRELQRKYEEATTAGNADYRPAGESAEAINLLMRDKEIRQLITDFTDDYWHALFGMQATENLAALVNEVIISIFSEGVGSPLLSANFPQQIQQQIQNAGKQLADIAKTLKSAGQPIKQNASSNSIAAEKVRRQIDVTKTPKLREHFLLRLTNKKGKAWSNKAFKVTTDSGVFNGKTNGQGVVKTKLNAQDLNGTLDIWLKDSEAEPTFSVPFAIDASELPDASTIQGIQARCNNLGFNAGVVDGINGRKTRNAVKGFQQQQKIQVDGIAGPVTQRKLTSAYGQ